MQTTTCPFSTVDRRSRSERRGVPLAETRGWRSRLVGGARAARPHWLVVRRRPSRVPPRRGRTGLDGTRCRAAGARVTLAARSVLLSSDVGPAQAADTAATCHRAAVRRKQDSPPPACELLRYFCCR
ncbi:hypothetical protein MRX96_055875 [Rhipicephalus microplus]